MAAVDDIFYEALTRSAVEDRRVFLAEACGGDTHLLRRVEQLLKAHERLGGFLERPAALLETPLAAGLRARYRVAGEIAAAAWGWSSRPTTNSSTGRSPSRSCWRGARANPSAFAASWKRRASAGACNT